MDKKIYMQVLLAVTIIFLTQSRLNILASFVFSFFFLLMIKNLSLGRKLVYFLLILVIPISVFNFYTDITKNRFSDSALKIYTDEGFHAYFTQKIANQITG